jgi:HTH-type transcriptional regulator, sugar sensing transcriptional regulator
MDKTILKKIGFSDKEIKIYLTLLEYGAISVRGLAELSGINRGTAYDILKKLQEQGLVSFYHEDTKQKFVAENPAKLLDLLKHQESELHKMKSGIEELIPELSLLQDRGDKHPTSKLYEGFKGVKYILEDVLNVMEDSKDKEYYIYSATELSEDMNKAYPDFTKARIKKNIRVKAISLAEGGRTHGLDERRWLGTHDKSATFIIIYDNKCAFISRDAKGSPVGVIIENKNIYKTEKIIFLRLWEALDENLVSKAKQSFIKKGE